MRLMCLLWSRLGLCAGFFCFVKQKTAYEMRISDWSSDVCSSDLRSSDPWRGHRVPVRSLRAATWRDSLPAPVAPCPVRAEAGPPRDIDRRRPAPPVPGGREVRLPLSLSNHFLHDAAIDKELDRKSTRLNSSH